MFGFKRKPKGRTTVDYRSIARRYHKYQCVRCADRVNLEVHHRNGNSHDNRPSNLEFRCRKHHLQAHGKKQRTRYRFGRAIVRRKKRRGGFGYSIIWVILLILLILIIETTI